MEEIDKGMVYFMEPAHLHNITSRLVDLKTTNELCSWLASYRLVERRWICVAHKQRPRARAR